MLTTEEKNFLDLVILLRFFPREEKEKLLARKKSLDESGVASNLPELLIQDGYLSPHQARYTSHLLKEGYVYCPSCQIVRPLSEEEQESHQPISCHRCERDFEKWIPTSSPPLPEGEEEGLEEMDFADDDETLGLAGGIFDIEPAEPVSAADVLHPQPSPGYKVLRTLGKGGYGVVYEVEDPQTARSMAIKILLRKNMKKERVVKRFQREIKITANLEHPNIIPVYESGSLQDNSLYYTMEKIRGGTLKHLIKSLQQQTTPQVSLTERLEIFLKICDALDYAHSRGVIHRDLKPSNVAIGNFGEVIVMDWGIAKSRGVEEVDQGATHLDLNALEDKDETITMQGTMLGTPGYMAPEQLRGKEATEKSDIFALGSILYELISLSSPFQGKTREKAMATLMKDVSAPHIAHPQRGIPEELSAIALKCLQKDPHDRYDSVKELKRDINLYLQGHSVSAKWDNPWQKFWKWMKRNSLYGEVVAVLLLLGVLWYWGIISWEKKQNKEEAGKELAKVSSLLSKKEALKAHELEEKYADLRHFYQPGTSAYRALNKSLSLHLKARNILEHSLDIVLKNKALRQKLRQKLFRIEREVGYLGLLGKRYYLSEAAFRRCLWLDPEGKSEKLLELVEEKKGEAAQEGRDR